MERREMIKIDVQSLSKVRFNREVHHVTWLANIILVKKTKGKVACVC